MADKDKKSALPDLTAEYRIITEAIEKEEKHIKLVENYGINPFRKREALAGKPNSPYDTIDPNAPIDKEFINTVNRDRSDRRLHHQHKYQDITLFNEFLIRSCPAMIKGDN